MPEIDMMPGWKERLLQAVESDGRSDRAISMAAGLGENFVNQLRNEDKEHSIKKVLKLADELGVSLSHLFIGSEITAEDEELFRLMRDTPPAERKALVEFLRARRSSE